MRDEARLNRRLAGIAHYWRKRFRLPYSMVDDLVNDAWVLWLKRDEIPDVDQRLRKVWHDLYGVVTKELYGHVPQNLHNAKRLEYVDATWIKDSCEPDYINRVRLREVCDKVAAGSKIGKCNKRARAFRMVCGLEDRSKVSDKIYWNSVTNLREFLRNDLPVAGKQGPKNMEPLASQPQTRRRPPRAGRTRYKLDGSIYKPLTKQEEKAA